MNDYICEDNLTVSVRANTRRILLGFSILTILWLAVTLLFAVVSAFIPGWTSSDWYTWAANEVPLYCVAFPIFYFAFVRPTQKTTLPRARVPFLQLLGVIPLCFTVMVAGSIIGRIVSGAFSIFPFFRAEDTLQEVLTESSSPLYLTLAFVCTVIIAPVMEELIFRKMLIDRTAALGEWTAVFVSGLFFALFHGNFYQFFYTFGLGLILGFIYVRTGRVAYTMCLHAVVNFSMGFLPVWMQPFYDTIESGTFRISQIVAIVSFAVVEYGLAALGIPLLVVAIRDAKRQLHPSPFSAQERRAILWRAPGMWIMIAASVVLVVLNLL